MKTVITEEWVREFFGTTGLAELQAIGTLLQDPSEEKMSVERIVTRVVWEGIQAYKAKISERKPE
jgi:hypothetical protein